MRENLKRFNKIRLLAQTIKNEGFKREYNNITLHVLQKAKICSDDELGKYVNEAIQKIRGIADTYQYIPNKCKNPDFSEHEKLFTLENYCNKSIQRL